MGIGFKELLVILVIVIIVFGAGRVPTVMKDVAKGIKEFKKGMAENDGDDNAPKA